jgi:agmatinase
MPTPVFLYESPDEIPAARPVAVIPAPMEVSVSWGRGTAGGPAALLAASQQVEYYDPELDAEPCLAFGIETLPALEEAEPKSWVASIEACCSGLLSSGVLPALVGGEHTVTLGAVQAACARGPLLVVQIDAHADLRDTYGGSPLSHACVMRRCREAGAEVLSVGVRAFSACEAGRMHSDPFHHAVAVSDLRADDAWRDTLSGLAADRAVYISVDLDGIDPAVVPAVGTPVPGGLTWEETLDVIRTACSHARSVAGLDVVELAPREGERRSDFAAASLLYFAIARAAKTNGFF